MLARIPNETVPLDEIPGVPHRDHRVVEQREGERAADSERTPPDEGGAESQAHSDKRCR
jgi:hypothetical protein